MLPRPGRLIPRAFSTSAPRGAERARDARNTRDTVRRRLPRRPLPPYREWVRQDGEQYRYPSPQRGPHWIGSTPFPLNPAFRPPPPVHQSVRDDMWKLHTAAPGEWTVRSLAEKFRLSLAKTEAVLRLKALEEEFVQEVRTHWGVRMRKPID